MIKMVLTDSEAKILITALYAKRNSYSQSLAKARTRIAAAYDVGAEADQSDVDYTKRLTDNIEHVDRMISVIKRELDDREAAHAENE